MNLVNKPLPSAGKIPTGAARSNLPWIVGILITLVVLTFIVAIFGSVSGEEFDPWRFRRQRYAFMQIPILRWQVRPTRYTDITSPTEIGIAAIIGAPPIPAVTVEGADEGEEVADDTTQNDATAESNTPSRWDLVETRRAGTEPWAGDAKILCDSLDTKDHNYNAFWDGWITKHPDAAKVLWPVVARMAQARLYVLIPDLLEVALNQDDATDVDSLSARLDRVVQNEGLKLAAALSSAKKHERALQAYELVLEYHPDSKIAADGVVTAKEAIESAKATAAESQPSAPVAEVDSQSFDDSAAVTAEGSQ